MTLKDFTINCSYYYCTNCPRNKGVYKLSFEGKTAKFSHRERERESVSQSLVQGFRKASLDEIIRLAVQMLPPV